MPSIEEYEVDETDKLTQNIKKILKKNLKTKVKKKPRTKEKNLYASLVGHCIRRSLYEQQNNATHDEETHSSYFYKKVGIAYEDILLNGMKSILVKKQYPVGIFLEEVNFNGFIDAIVKIDNKYYVVEIKTCTSLPDMPKLSHKGQAEVYSAITGLDYILIYMTRNGFIHRNDEFDIVAFSYEYNEEKSREIIRNIYRASEVSRLDGKYVTGERLRYIKDCEYCPFIDKCKRNTSLDDFTQIDINTLYDYEMEISEFFSDAQKDYRLNKIIS